LFDYFDYLLNSFRVVFIIANFEEYQNNSIIFLLYLFNSILLFLGKYSGSHIFENNLNILILREIGLVFLIKTGYFEEIDFLYILDFNASLEFNDPHLVYFTFVFIEQDIRVEKDKRRINCQ
jgi:hypothetical protein